MRFFLRFLDVVGIARKRLVYRVYIHEQADVERAQTFWSEVTATDIAQFQKPTLKRHNPKTVRRNTGDRYYGCLRIDVRRSTEEYRRIEGWASGILTEGAVD